MQYGTALFSYDDLSVFECLDRIKAMGFDFVALHVCEGWEEHVQYCRKIGLPIENVHLQCRGTSKLWGNEGWEEILEGYLNQIRTCGSLGIRRAIAHVTYGIQLDPPSPEGLERFAKIVSCAQKEGVTLAFENSRATAHLYTVLDHFQGENTVFCYDSGHDLGMALGTEFFNAFLPRYGHRLGALHLHDTIPGFDMHAAPFDGAIDWEIIARQLAATDYAREKLCVEPGGKINAKKEGKTAAELRECYKKMAIAQTPLMEFHDGYYTAYANLSMEEYLDRWMTGLKRISKLMERD